MTHKAFRYSDHAADALRRRAVTRQGVRHVYATGVRTLAGNPPEVWYCDGEWRGRPIRLVYREGAAGVYLITIIRLDEPREA